MSESATVTIEQKSIYLLLGVGLMLIGAFSILFSFLLPALAPGHWILLLAAIICYFVSIYFYLRVLGSENLKALFIRDLR